MIKTVGTLHIVFQAEVCRQNKDERCKMMMSADWGRKRSLILSGKFGSTLLSMEMKWFYQVLTARSAHYWRDGCEAGRIERRFGAEEWSCSVPVTRKFRYCRRRLQSL